MASANTCIASVLCPPRVEERQTTERRRNGQYIRTYRKTLERLELALDSAHLSLSLASASATFGRSALFKYTPAGLCRHRVNSSLGHRMRILLTAYAVVRPLERALCRTIATGFVSDISAAKPPLERRHGSCAAYSAPQSLAAGARFVPPRDGRGCVTCQELTRVRDGLTRRTDNTIVSDDSIQRFLAAYEYLRWTCLRSMLASC